MPERRKDYRMALRSVEEWEDPDRMDDIVVNDVSMFRMEQMSERHWWMQCHLGPGYDDYITFDVYWDRKLKEVVVRVTEYPAGDHVYEDDESAERAKQDNEALADAIRQLEERMKEQP